MKKISSLVTAAAASLLLGCNDHLLLAPSGTTANSKLTICHAVGKKGKFELITIKASAAQAHIDHGDFLAPAGATKASQCIVTPPSPVDTVVVVPPVVVPPVVVDTVVVVPPVVVPPVVDTVVVPPVVVPPIVEDGEGTKTVPDEDRENLPCISDDWRPECQL